MDVQLFLDLILPHAPQLLHRVSCAVPISQLYCAYSHYSTSLNRS